MRNGRWFLRRFLVIVTAGASQQTAAVCSGMSYENRNQVDFGPLLTSAITGTATDTEGVAIPRVCVGVFTETDDTFIAATQTNDSGRFELKGVADGNYRVLAKYNGFGPANARIRVGHSGRKRPLALHMRFAGMDTTSYFELR